MRHKIYGLYDEDNNLRYIGYTSVSLKKRLQRHIARARVKATPNNHRIAWIRGLAAKGKKPKIGLIMSYGTKEKAFEAEIDFIAFYQKQGVPLTNSCSGGKGAPGYKWTEEDYKRKVKQVDQYSQKGELIATYFSLSEAAEAITGDRKKNSKISSVCRGKRRIAFKYIWRFTGDAFDKYPTTIDYQAQFTPERRAKMSKFMLGNQRGKK